MTQITTNKGVKPDTLSRFCNPNEIIVPRNLAFDEVEVVNIIKAFEAQSIVPEIIVSQENELIEGINVLEATKRLNQEIIIASIKSEPNKFQLIATDLLDIHPLNTSIYGEDEDLSELIGTIKRTGWIEPLVVTPDGDRFRVISGNSRKKVCSKLDIKQVECDIRNFSCEAEEIRFLLAGNVAREKSIARRSDRPSEDGQEPPGKFSKE
jgi:acetolactate synthase small subunit